MTFSLIFTQEADNKLNELKSDPSQKSTYKAIKKCLGYIETNLKHPSLQTHPFTSLKGPRGEKVFTAYVEQNRPTAYRIFWYYGPEKGEITIATITPHQ